MGGGVRWQQIMGGGENIDISLDTLVFCLWPNASINREDKLAWWRWRAKVNEISLQGIKESLSNGRLSWKKDKQKEKIGNYFPRW